MNVLLLSRYGALGASSRIRAYQYLPFLAADGIRVSVAPLLDDAYLRSLYGPAGRGRRAWLAARNYARRLRTLLSAGRFDLLWVEYEMLPWLPAWAEALLARRGVPYVVDYDDAIFHRYDSHRNIAVRRLLGGKIGSVMRHARLVLAGNRYLGDYALRSGAHRVELLPTVIDLDRYQHVRPQSGPPHHPFTVGWIGTPVTARYLDLVEDSLHALHKNGPLKIRLIGADARALAGSGLPVERVPWSEDGEVAAIAGCDVGIMPLPDAPWERGKCGYKLIQYAACGLPVVASPVGVNAEIVDDGGSGFLASTGPDWAHALRTLQGDPALRQRMGATGRARVEERYSLQVTAPRLATLLRSAAATTLTDEQEGGTHVRHLRVP